ncbi:MAG: hypothetical protein ACRCZ0_09395 [Cetobacterium sp.]
MSEKSMRFVNMDTGEIIVELKDMHSSKVIKKHIVDDMLNRAENVEDLDSAMLYAWCKITKEINGYGQIKLCGPFRDKATEKRMLEDITITGYAMRVFDKAHPFSGMLKSNHKSFISTWKELYDEIDCKKRGNQIKLKTFLIESNLVREFKVGGIDGKLVKRMIVNPFLVRGATHSSQVSIMVFQDCISEGSNIGTYPIRWLQSLGYLA